MTHPFNPLLNNGLRADDVSKDRARMSDHVTNKPKSHIRRHRYATVAEARRLIEETALSCRQIAAQTGVSRRTLANWIRKHRWQRHPYAPPANDTLPAARAGRCRQLRMLAVKLHALAERCVIEQWNNPVIDCDRLVQALRTVKALQPDALGHRCPRPRADMRPRTGAEWVDRETRIRQALARLRRDNAGIDHIPEQAMAMVADGHRLPKRAPRARSASA